MDNKLIGRRHCGGLVFDVPGSLDFSAASRCDCSFCRRRAAVMVSCALDLLKIQQGYDLLTLYQWNTHTDSHYFCKICDIHTFHQRRIDPSIFDINIGCFEDLSQRNSKMHRWKMVCRSGLCVDDILALCATAFLILLLS